MGPFTVGVPLKQYQGAFVDNTTSGSSSKLVGSDRTEDEVIAQYMSERLSQKLKQQVFVSCHLQGKAPSPSRDGEKGDTSLMTIAAYAERGLYDFLKDKIR